MKKAIIVFLAVVGLGAGVRVFGQLTAAEQGEYDKWEDFLKTAKIVDQEQLTGALAVTQPWILTLEKDGVRRRALWKNALGERVQRLQRDVERRDRRLPAEPPPGAPHGPGHGRTRIPG